MKKNSTLFIKQQIHYINDKLVAKIEDFKINTNI